MGLRLRPLREAAGLTQYATAMDLGVSHVAYLKWESGQGYPRADKLPAIADLFGVSIDALFGRTGPDDTILPTEGGERHGARVPEYLQKREDRCGSDTGAMGGVRWVQP